VTTVAQKAEYVKSQGQNPDNHHCHWPGCGLRVAPSMWGCRRHWYCLPRVLRNKIWAAYRPGQEIDKRPSKSYIDVAREVQNWIKENAQ